MFVFRKVIFGKPLFKFSCVCLPLGKLVNGKHFLVNEKHFPIKEKFSLVSRKMFSLCLCLFSGKQLSKLFYVCLSLEKLINGKHFPVKEKFGLVFRKVFSWFGRKTLSGNCEKFRNVIICLLYQIWSSNFWLLYIYIFCFEYLFFNFIS